MTERPTRARSTTAEPPVLTNIAMTGDVARERGIYFQPRKRASSDGDYNPPHDAEKYLAERFRSAVRESLSEAMIRAARAGTRGNKPTRDGDTGRSER